MSSTSTRKLAGFVALGGEAPFVNPNKVVIIGLDEPETEKNWFAHCARLKDETDADLADYVADIRRIGKVDDPIDVYRDGDRLILLDGRRSTRAARIVWAEQAEAKKKLEDRVSLRVLIRKGTPDELFRYNVDSHKKKPLTNMQKARLYLNFYQRHAEDEAKTATFFDVTVQSVKNSLSLFDLAPKLQDAVDEGVLPLREAIKLTGKKRDEQEKILAELIATGSTKGAAASNAIAKAKRGEKVSPRPDHTKMRPRGLLEKWGEELKKIRSDDRPEVDPYELLAWVLGGPLPRGIQKNDILKDSLVKAGFKMPKAA